MKILWSLFFLFSGMVVSAQTNTFPSSGNVGVGTTSPTKKLDVLGDVLLRNMNNSGGAGPSISFSSYDYSHLGPRIRSFLDFANGPSSASRLILSSYGNGYHDELTLMNGNVGIGTITPQERLSVNGKIRAHEVKVENGNWPDFVFAENYKLPSLEETSKYIQQHKHLPGIPSAAEVKDRGIDLGDMNARIMQKIEELTLHLIELKAENEGLKKKVRLLEAYKLNNQ